MALCKPRVFAKALGRQDLVIEDLEIQTDARGTGVVGAAEGIAGKPVLAGSARRRRLG